VRWFARKAKPQAPVLKPPAQPVRVRRLPAGAAQAEALARDRAAHDAERSSSPFPPPREPAKPG
jgi:hypothetical protein